MLIAKLGCTHTEQPSVVPTISDEWFCLSCLTIHNNEVGLCGYCSEFVTGDLETSYISGCLMCDGQIGHHIASRAYSRDD